MKYDDASWHYGGDFPADLPDSAGATHIGMFVAWAMLNGLAGEIHTADFPEEYRMLHDKAVMPGQWFLSACDERFTDEDLNDEGNAFARSYYTDDSGLRSGDGSYLADYSAVFPDGESLYHVPDSWETYAKLEPVILSRFAAWQLSR